MTKESGSSEQPRLATGFESVANGFEHRQGGCLHTQRQCLLSTGEKVRAGKVEEGWQCGRVWTPVAPGSFMVHTVFLGFCSSYITLISITHLCFIAIGGPSRRGRPVEGTGKVSAV